LGFSVTVDWGLYEGSDTIIYPAGTTSFTMTHDYVDDGSQPFVVEFPITISVTASDGLTATASTSTMGVDVVPTVNITGEPSTIEANTPVTVSAVVADPGEYGVFTYRWTATGGGDSFSGTSDTFNFTPSNDDAHAVTLTVTDADSETVSQNITIPGGPSGGTITAFQPDAPTVTIEECDADGNPDSNPVEAGTPAYFLVSVGGSMPHQGSVTVYYNTANGAAIDGGQVACADTDYIASGDQELTFSSDSGYAPQTISVDTIATSNGGTLSVDVPCYIDPFAATPGTATWVNCTIDQGLTIQLTTEATNQRDINVTGLTTTLIVGQWTELVGSNGSLPNVQSEGWSDPAAWNANPPEAVAGYTMSFNLR
jgi:hypothetical protein